MGKSRKTFTPVENELLYGQVGGNCPICASSLTYFKNGKPQKQYEIAHIYPLNPTPEEITLLKDEEKLSDNLNSLDNLIPLCPNCHTKFDKPRTVGEYKTLLEIKKRFIQSQSIKSLYGHYTIESEINEIIKMLTSIKLDVESTPLEYSVLRIDDKLSQNFDQILRKHIKDDVSQYYNYIKTQFKHIEQVTPGKFDLIAGQIKTFYLNAKMKGTDQVLIFNQMAEWVQMRTGNFSIDSCKVIIAFFIQNCEVFEYAAK